MKNTFLCDRIAGTALIFLVLAGVMISNGCLSNRYNMNPDVPGFHHSIRLKFNLRNDREQQNGKILMLFDALRAKILFLSPLNQVYFQLLVENNQSFLINNKKKKYWQGDFDELIRKMWAINLGFDDLKRLIQLGAIPKQKLNAAGLQLDLEKQGKTGTPKRITLRGDRVLLDLKIINQRQKKGAVQFYWKISQFDRTDIDEVLVYK
jgi:hypothetical protein